MVVAYYNSWADNIHPIVGSLSVFQSSQTNIPRHHGLVHELTHSISNDPCIEAWEPFQSKEILNIISILRGLLMTNVITSVSGAIREFLGAPNSTHFLNYELCISAILMS